MSDDAEDKPVKIARFGGSSPEVQVKCPVCLSDVRVLLRDGRKMVPPGSKIGLNFLLDMDLLTVKEVSALCGVTQRTVLIWLNNGKLVGYRLAGSKHNAWRIPAEEVISFLGIKEKGKR